MEMRTIRDAGGSTLHFKYFDGILFPPNVLGDVKSHLDAIKQLKHKDGDVLLDTYPKTGTHWGFEIIHMLVTGKADYYPHKTLALEFEPVESHDALEDPRVLTSHLYPQHIPQSLIDNRSKIVYVYRNPKDTAVSFFSFLKILNAELLQGYDSSWDDFLTTYMTEQVPYNSWFEHLKAWLDFKKSNPEVPILFIAFEDMKKDLRSSVEKIAEFLAVKRDSQFLEEVANKCQFNAMLKDKNCKDETKMGIDGKNPFYRKGEVGGWKDRFTVAQNEMYDTVIKENITGIDLDMKYTL